MTKAPGLEGVMKCSTFALHILFCFPNNGHELPEEDGVILRAVMVGFCHFATVMVGGGARPPLSQRLKHD